MLQFRRESTNRTQPRTKSKIHIYPVKVSGDESNDASIELIEEKKKKKYRTRHSPAMLIIFLREETPVKYDTFVKFGH